MDLDTDVGNGQRQNLASNACLGGWGLVGQAPRSRSPGGQCCKQRRKPPSSRIKTGFWVGELRELECASVRFVSLRLVARFGLFSQRHHSFPPILHLSGVNTRLGSWITTAKLRIQDEHWGVLVAASQTMGWICGKGATQQFLSSTLVVS